MSLIRRRIAALGPLTPAAILALRDEGTATPTVHTGTEEHDPTSTIAPFATALNGVDQDSNMLYKDVLWWTLGIMALAMLAIRLLDIAWSKLRHVSTMSVPAEKQGYWRKSQWSWMPGLKKHLIYAPLWRKRHNREIKLSSAVSIGTLPSRLHTVILGIYLISNMVYMFHVNWSQENQYALAAEIRGRSGTLSVVSMVPLIILAGRNNPLIAMLRVSFDTYNLLHRWMGRIVVIEAIIHTVAWAYVAAAADGYEGMNFKLTHETFLASGFAGTIALVVLFFLSLSPVRHAFYETFLNIHIILALIVFIMTWVHCATAQLPGGLPQLSWMMAIFLLWLAERVARMFRLAYNNWSRSGLTEAVIEPMPADACRVTVHLPRYVDIEPGTHAYLRFMGVNPWENHPFSVAWVEHRPGPDMIAIEEEKDSSVSLRRGGKTSVSFVIGAHSGFTRKLYDKALKGGGQPIRLRAAMEGPYAGHHSLESYGHVVLFAGSTGITHQISYIRPLIQGFNDETIATRRITLVWIIRDTESLEWVRPWMDDILRMPRRREVLNIRLFVTRPKNAREIHSASTTVQMLPGRPNIPTLLKKEVEEQIGAMCVTVCGPGGLADDVRQAVREIQDVSSVVDFVEESFTW
ncbi:ferric reductase NAD binding domain-containing protein [Durotheca rogersii]|uniref:ferric reductase NAD binding domain-containing protein n=1 Tax=Durotheca rogersii TaxID=419775 RepID=UPI0022209547|nr:ferric reductase NAD binding domain-containing protein [Durotheca rogersii]KAI5860730.1 ferric reductase NAD binding domain-containing protein [Durotheca rogersii]